MQVSDRITGAFLIALGGVAAYAGSRLPPVPGQQVGPNVFPTVVGIGLVVCGALIALRVGHRFEEQAEANPAADSNTAPAPAPASAQWWRGPAAGWWRHLAVIVPPALLVFYVLLVEHLGFIATAAIMVLASELVLGGRLRLALPLALVTPFAVHLVFYKLLRVPLPIGLIPTPW
jgi:putative tricarboxylic transport membrane protein